MGGMLNPVSKGEIDGHKNGLGSDLSIYEFTRNLEFEKFKSDYWVGFGAGYINGQTLRSQMKKIDCKLSFEERIECCQFLFLNSSKLGCKINPQDYLDNIQNWSHFEIDFIICQTSLNYLEENKIQRAIDAVFTFYKNNFRLKALKEFCSLDQDLKNMRNEKGNAKNYDTSKDRAKIESDLKSWIEKNGQKE